MPTDDFGSACAHRGLPFINDCDVDGAGELLRHLLGTLQARNDGALGGRFVEFDQHEFIAADEGMAATGWLFVPQACATQRRLSAARGIARLRAERAVAG